MAQSRRGSHKLVQGRREASLRAKITGRAPGAGGSACIASLGVADAVVACGWRARRERSWSQRGQHSQRCVKRRAQCLGRMRDGGQRTRAGRYRPSAVTVRIIARGVPWKLMRPSHFVALASPPASSLLHPNVSPASCILSASCNSVIYLVTCAILSAYSCSSVRVSS